MLPPGATDIKHQASRRYGGRRTGGATKGSRLRATGLMLGNAVLGAVETKLDVTQKIAFRWRKGFFKEKRELKESGSILSIPCRRLAKMVLDKIYQDGRQTRASFNMLTRWEKPT